MPRLLLISEHFEPCTGATAQLMSDLARGLHQRGWQITVLTATPGADLIFPVVRLNGPVRPGGVTPGVVGKALRGLRFLLGSLLWCLRRGRRGDGVLIVSNPPFIGLLGPLLRLWRGLPYVFIFQDLFPRSAVLSGVLPAAGPLALLWQGLMGQVCGRSSRTVVLSQAMEARLRRDLGRQLPLTVIHNWAVERGAAIRRADSGFAAEHGYADRFSVQYSGNFGRLHDLLTLLEAARLLQQKPIQFVFIGGGAKQSQIEAYRSGFALSNVLQLPYQPRRRLPQSLASCDLAAIGLIPGAEDTVAPCKFYGILASGRPVLLIARRSCDLAQLVLNVGCGLVVEPGEAAELAEQLLLLSQQPDHVRAMGERSLALYQQRFGLERSLERYEAVLKELLQPAP
ncbi:MAG: glycosyltransferase family 4 protein [Cyanobacteria bacterium K_Offshore_0m_m2_072]|nr:glycosyltransferase family 4 protein [Cyanobacteria bacterium K_Offshore_0m_m2_072]